MSENEEECGGEVAKKEAKRRGGPRIGKSNRSTFSLSPAPVFQTDKLTARIRYPCSKRARSTRTKQRQRRERQLLFLLPKKKQRLRRATSSASPRPLRRRASLQNRSGGGGQGARPGPQPLREHDVETKTTTDEPCVLENTEAKEGERSRTERTRNESSLFSSERRVSAESCFLLIYIFFCFVFPPTPYLPPL